MAFLTVENLSFTYADAEAPSLSNIDFSVDRGEFVLLCGETGCGKTTLLRLMKKALAPVGARNGKILLESTDCSALSDREAAKRIGFVMQDPEAQIVTDRVWHELAFGGEAVGMRPDELRLAVAEAACYFGLDSRFRQDTASLSGGTKQLLNLASVMTAAPELLLLDEPTSQLDPISSASFTAALHRLNTELGITVIAVEHRLEELFPLADRIGIIKEGRLVFFGTPEEAVEYAGQNDPSVFELLPASARLHSRLCLDGRVPLSVAEGRRMLSGLLKGEKPSVIAEEPPRREASVALSLKEVYFRYSKNAPDILRGCSLTVNKGEIFSLLGGNGCGKTTLLKLASGLKAPYSGRVLRPLEGSHRGGTVLLPQALKAFFTCSSIRDELESVFDGLSLSGEEAKSRAEELARELGIDGLLDRHPYDLSGGELQKCALLLLLMTEPSLLLLDEPTKGLDAASKSFLARLLARLSESGVTVLLVTHDVEFAAVVSDRCGLLFDGELVASAPPAEFFSRNKFYTTSAARLARGFVDGAVTVEALTKAVRSSVDSVCFDERIEINE